MALDKQKINIAFAQGVDTKSDPKQVIPGKLLTLENGVFQKTNSIIKRNGYTALNTSGLSNAVGLSTFKDQLFMLSQRSGDNYISGSVYSPTNNYFSLYKGYYSPVNVNRYSAGAISGVTTPFTVLDSCVSGTLQCFIYSKATSATAETLFYSIRDLTTNAFLIKDGIISSSISAIGSYVRVVKFGSNFALIFSATITTAKLWYALVSPTVLTTSPLSPVEIAVTGSSAQNYASNTAIDAIVNNDILYVTYADGTASNTLTVATINLSYTKVLTSLTGMNAANGSAIVADTSNNNVWIASCASSTPNVKVVSYTNNMASQRFSPFTVESTFSGRQNIVMTLDAQISDKVWLYWGRTTSGNEYTDPVAVRYAAVTYSGGVASLSTGPSTLLHNATVYAKPYIYNNSVKLPVICHDQYAAYSIYVIDGSGAWCDAKLVSGGGNPLRGNPMSTWEPTNDKFYFMAVEKNVDSKGYIAYAYDLSYDHKPVFAELANNLHITGGFLYMFDGQNLCEHNFLVSPTICTGTVAAGGTIPAGDYYYQYTYEWADAYGQLHISAPSTVSAKITATGSNKINLTIPCLNLTNKIDTGGNKVYIGIYRSNDGLIFYKNSNTGVNGSLVNNQTAATVPFEDNYTFAAAYENQPLLYTVGGEVPNIDPGAVTYVTTYNQRLIAIPSESPSTWWYSKEIIPAAPGNAGTPVYFSDEFISIVDERSGGITGVLQLDEKLVFFKRNNIFALAGNGPAPDLSGNDFNPPQVIATDTGCIEGQSLVLGPSGIMFKSAKGIYLIDRSLSVSYIGAPVEAYNNVEVVSADLIYNLNQFRLGLSSGVALVYNYLFDQWSVFTNHAVIQACIYQNKYTFCKSSAVVWQESTGFQDDGSAIPLKLTTSWLSFADLQGFQRVYKLMLLGTWKSSHTLTVDVYHDFVDTIAQTSTIPLNANIPPYMYRVFMTRQKCTAIKYTIQDNASNEGYEISAMAFEVGIKRGLNKLSAARSVG